MAETAMTGRTLERMRNTSVDRRRVTRGPSARERGGASPAGPRVNSASVMSRRRPNRRSGSARPSLTASEGPFAWWRDADIRARRAFVAASLGWMLDSFDVMLYSLVLAALIQDPTLAAVDRRAPASSASITLLAAAGGRHRVRRHRRSTRAQARADGARC